MPTGFINRRGPELDLPEQLVCDSRQAGVETGFVAVRGGHGFVDAAVSAGVRVVVHQEELPHYLPGVCYYQVADSAAFYACWCRQANAFPDESLDLFGVTGTNGKTTSVWLLAHILNACGRPCGLISTVEIRDGYEAVPAVGTTPGPAELFARLKKMCEHGMAAAAMEVSSHALDQRRADGIRFRTAIFTNLTGDHLDYHGDMENYYQAKRRLFAELLEPVKGRAVINIDDPGGRRLAAELPPDKVISFGTAEEAIWRISGVRLSDCGTKFTLSSTEQSLEINSPLIGEHNVYNLTGVVCSLLDYGLTGAEVVSALGIPVAVPGRLERIQAPGGATFFIDYAHTDDALTHVIATLQAIARGRVIVVFGAGGDRDRFKRPRMGAAAAAADVLVVTSDNPRSEEPTSIIAHIIAGIPEDKPFHIFVDRREAIEFAFQEAGAGDCVLIAGKGHEDYQEINGVRHHFSDREEVLRLLGQ